MHGESRLHSTFFQSEHVRKYDAPFILLMPITSQFARLHLVKKNIPVIVKNINFNRLLNFVFALLFVFFLTLTLVANFSVNNGQQYSLLARSFLHGRIYIDSAHGDWMKDTVLINGRYYWPLGPAPAVLLMPFVLIFDKLRLFFYQGYLHFFLNLIVLYFCYKFARRFKYSLLNSLYLAFAFVFSSVYLLSGLVSASWFFAQVVTVVLLFLAINEYFRERKRYFLIGAMFALIFATRFSAGIGLLLFLPELVFSRKLTVRSKFKNLVLLFVPIVLSGIALLEYNQLRFGNPFNNGYLLANNWLAGLGGFYKPPYGLFSLKYVVNNFYSYFLRLPIGFFQFPLFALARPGVSLFVVSPVFLYIFRADFKKNIVKLSVLVSILITFVLLSYFFDGWQQIGPRYMLDVLPFLYIILLNSFKDSRLNTFSKLVIIFGSLINFYFLYALYLITP